MIDEEQKRRLDDIRETLHSLQSLISSQNTVRLGDSNSTLSELVQLVDTVEDNLSLKESIITEAPNWNADQIKDPYELLGVSEDDDQETIRKHAKNLSDQHPDYHPEINAAMNSILSN